MKNIGNQNFFRMHPQLNIIREISQLGQTYSLIKVNFLKFDPIINGGNQPPNSTFTSLDIKRSYFEDFETILGYPILEFYQENSQQTFENKI